MNQSSLPSYAIEIVPVAVRTPKPGNPTEFTQEMYDLWIANEDHIRLEEKADAGKMWFWAARIIEHVGDQHQSIEVHSQAFNTDNTNGFVNLREFQKEIAKEVSKRAKKTIGPDDTSLIIRP